MRCSTSSDQVNDTDFKWKNKYQNHDHSHDHDHITSKKEISNRVTGENVYFRKVEEME